MQTQQFRDAVWTAAKEVYFITNGDAFCYSVPISTSFQQSGTVHKLVQFKSPRVELQKCDLTDADRLNGFAEIYVFKLTSSAKRVYGRDDWLDWMPNRGLLLVGKVKRRTGGLERGEISKPWVDLKDTQVDAGVLEIDVAFNEEFMLAANSGKSALTPEKSAGLPVLAAVTNSPNPVIDDYDKQMNAAIQKRWTELLHSRGFAGEQLGRVVIAFQLHQDGTVSNMRFVERTVDRSMAEVALSAVKDAAPFSKWPDGMRLKVGEDVREVKCTFMLQ